MGVDGVLAEIVTASTPPRCRTGEPRSLLAWERTRSIRPSSSVDVGGIWRELSHPDKVSVHQVGDETTGHFIVNEKQEETGKRLREWLDTLEL